MLTARPLSIWDTAFCWRLANEPSVRAASHDQRPPTLLGHLRWMASWLFRSDRQAWVVDVRAYGLTYTADRPAGLARAHADGTVSIGVLPEYRGRGVALFGVNVATGFVEAGMLSRATPTAYIRSDNGPSIGLFAKAGYEMARASDGIVVMQRRAA